MRQWFTLMIGGLCLTLASSAHALGVGEPQQLSPLNRPLHVVLPLTDGGGLETSQISVAIANDDAYRQSGLARSALTDTVTAKVVREGRTLSVVLDSPRRVKEPFLDLLLVVTWPQGQWQRDISLLFDPVDYASVPPLIDGDRSVAQRYDALASSATDAMPTAASVAAAWPQHVTVRSGDSLSTLAASLLPHSGVNREALMVALFQSNPAAFIEGDVNRLRAGVSLDVPSPEDVAAISRREAAATLAALSETQDGRPVIDIVARENASVASRTPASGQLATLKQQLSELTVETERQRATIDALQTERNALQGALALVASPSPLDDAGDVNAPADTATPVTAAAISTDGVTAGGSRAEVTSGVVATAAVAAPETSPASLPSPPIWLHLLEHLDWLGEAVLILLVLLGLWVWQRRRRRSRNVATPSSRNVDAPTAGTFTQGAASPGRLSAGDADSAAISQADIYMAYGRHGDARDWLRQQLMQAEDAHLRLGLLRALGELREMEALEEALSEFGYDATSEQRREGGEIADYYRARYVEESWQEATAEDAEGQGEREDQGEREGEREDETNHVESGDTREVDGLFESQTASFETHADSSRQTSPGDLGEAYDRHDSVSALLDEEWAGPPEPADASLMATTIDYQAPTLELNATPSERTLPSLASSSDASYPSSRTWGEMPLPKPTIDFSALSLEPADEATAGDSLQPITGGSHASPDKPSSGHQEVPVGWDVEEVEFQSPHRDNGRP